MNRTERITILLDHYIDVIHGVYDQPRTHDGPVLMCRAWNHPSYQQLERLRLQLRHEQPRLHWHLAETYFRPIQRRTAYCPRCQQHAPPSHIGHVHKHGRRTIALVPRIQRVISPLVKAGYVNEGIRWLDTHWQGEPQIPADLRGVSVDEEREVKVA